jgi:hypothetical protein
MTPTFLDEPSSDRIRTIVTLDDADRVASLFSIVFGAILREAATALISRSRRDCRELIEDAETWLESLSLDDEADLRISSTRYDLFSEDSSADALEMTGAGDKKASLEDPVKFRK